MAKITELRKSKEEHNGEYYTPFYDEPLIDYVQLIAEKYSPSSPMDKECGIWDSRAIGDFLTRYFDNRIANKDKVEEYLNNEELLEAIEAIGYDIQKFWYLTLFIFDFSKGAVINKITPKPSPKKTLKDFAQKICDNIESIDNSKQEIIEFKKPIKVSLEIEGQRTQIIDDPKSLLSFTYALLVEIERIEEGSNLDTTLLPFKGNRLDYDPASISHYIWYFAQMFLSFFDLKPPLKKRAPKNSGKSYSKLSIISRLVYLLQLSSNDSYLSSEEELKGILNKYRNTKLDSLNGYYLPS